LTVSNRKRTSALPPVGNTSVSGSITDVLPTGGSAEVRLRFDTVNLLPDQLVPLSLLATEVVSNAVKYMGAPKDGPAWIEVALMRAPDAQGEIVFPAATRSGPHR